MVALLYSTLKIMSNTQTPQLTTNSEKTVWQAITTGTTESGDVAIELKPQAIQDGAITFLMTANTHSVDLSQFNLQKITTLTYNGKVISPSAVPQLTGHHTSGILVFPMDKNSATFTVSIKGIPLEQERVFRWS